MQIKFSPRAFRWKDHAGIFWFSETKVNENSEEYLSVKEHESILKSLRASILDLQNTIQWYADKVNYGSDDKSNHDGFECFDIVLFDFSQSDTEKMRRHAGKRAKQALDRLKASGNYVEKV